MRDREATRDIPVIVVTGQVLAEEEVDRLNQGVAAILGKGLFTPEEIAGRIQRALGSQRGLGGPTRQLVRRASAFIHAHLRRADHPRGHRATRGDEPGLPDRLLPQGARRHADRLPQSMPDQGGQDAPRSHEPRGDRNRVARGILRGLVLHPDVPSRSRRVAARIPPWAAPCGRASIPPWRSWSRTPVEQADPRCPGIGQEHPVR